MLNAPQVALAEHALGKNYPAATEILPGVTPHQESSQLVSIQLGPSQLGPSQLDSSQLDSSQLDSSQLDSAQLE